MGTGQKPKRSSLASFKHTDSIKSAVPKSNDGLLAPVASQRKKHKKTKSQISQQEIEDDPLGFQEFHLDYNKSKEEIVTVVNHDFHDDDLYAVPEMNTVPSTRTDDSNVINDKTLEESDEDVDDSDDDEWKEMKTQLNWSDVYNLKGELIESFVHSNDNLTLQNKAPAVSSSNHSSNINLGDTLSNSTTSAVSYVGGLLHKKKHANTGTGVSHEKDNSKSGYTRIADEEQAKKYNQWNKKFDYLFSNENSNFRKLKKANKSSSHLPSNTTSTDDLSIISETTTGEGTPQPFQIQESEILSTTTKLATTKSMLTDSQKIAYAGLVQLIILQQHEKLAELRGSGSIKTLKGLAKAHKSFTRWEMDTMDQIYDHLDIKPGKERDMIMNLGRHGIIAKDLVNWLDLNLSKEISNPLLNDAEDLKVIDADSAGNQDEDIQHEEKLQIDIKWSLICDLFLNLLNSSIYDARSRTLLLHFAESIGIETMDVYQFERRISDALEFDESNGTIALLNNATTHQEWDETDILKEHRKKTKRKRMVAVGLATIGGGLVIGLSAGLLAPVIGAGLAAGLSTIGIGGTSTFLAGTAGASIVTVSGVLSGMKTGKNGMTKRVGSVKTFEFKPLHSTGRVNLIITVSGWMSGQMDDVRLPFSTVDPVMGDLFSVLWEPELLTSMGQTIGILATEVLTQSIQQILGNTVLVTLMGALQLPMMLSKLGYLLDNPWNVSLDRAWAAGLVLADTLRRRKLGVRPATLVGFSLGARLIYSCLLDLARTGDYGLVENVYLFGSPFAVKIDQIALARSVVSGRFVNGYSKKDWILGYLFRATAGGLSTIAGLSPIKHSYGEKEGIQEVDDESSYYPMIENMDCSELVTGHMEYRKVMPKLLRKLGWEVLNDEFIEIDDPDPKQTERQRKLVADFEEAKEKMKTEGAGNDNKKKKKWFGWMKPKKKEWWEMYEEGENDTEQRKVSAHQDMKDDNGHSEHEYEYEHEPEKEKAKEGESSAGLTPVESASTSAATPQSTSLFNINELIKEVENIEKGALELKEFKTGKRSTEGDSGINSSSISPVNSPSSNSIAENLSPTSMKSHKRSQSIPGKSFDLHIVKNQQNDHVEAETLPSPTTNGLKPFKLRQFHKVQDTDDTNSSTQTNKPNRYPSLRKSPSLNLGKVVISGRYTSSDTKPNQFDENDETKDVDNEVMHSGFDYGDDDEFGGEDAGEIVIDYDDLETDDYQHQFYESHEDDDQKSVVVHDIDTQVDNEVDLHAEEKVKHNSVDYEDEDDKPFDYDDEDEFPTEEKEIEISFY